MVLAAGTLAYLLAVAVVDHWVIAGGLGFWDAAAVLAVAARRAAAPISSPGCCPP